MLCSSSTPRLLLLPAISPLPSSTAVASSSFSPQIPRRYALISTAATSLSFLSPFGAFVQPAVAIPSSAPLDFFELQDSGGVKALDLRLGEGDLPQQGDQVAIHYYGRLAAKQGWRFDSTYDHKDETGDSVPFEFVLGSGKVITGIEAAVKSMRVGGIRRVIIPPSQGYQNTSQEPIPPNRLFTTIFNPTRLANGEGSTLGTLIFNIELAAIRRPAPKAK